MGRIHSARRLAGLVGVALLLLVVAACGERSSGGEVPAGESAAATTGVDESARSLLPDDVSSGGVLRIATSLQWPPFGYKGENGDPEGLDLDLMEAIASKLGLETRITDIKFDSIVPSVGNGRFHVGVNEMADIPERRKTVQFVDYYKTGLAVLVPKDSESDIQPDDLCGHRMSLTQGSSQAVLGEEISKQCEADGKPPIDFEVFSDSASTILAVANERVEGFMTDYAVGVYLTRTTNKSLKVLPGVIPNSDEQAGIVIAKDEDQLAKAIQAALQSLIDDGGYQRIMDHWGVGDRAVEEATINRGQGSGGG